MTVRDVVVWPDPRLRQETHDIDSFGEETHALYRDLTDTMYAQNGLGIAAIQIGDPRRMFLVEGELAGLGKDSDPVAFINPQVIENSEDIQVSEEGCLSFPGIFIKVDRPWQTTVRAQNLEGQTFEVKAEELYARCLLHEYDHLTGKLLVDFVGPLKKKMIRRKLQKSRTPETS